jgi:hypothetical protein
MLIALPQVRTPSQGPDAALRRLPKWLPLLLLVMGATTPALVKTLDARVFGVMDGAKKDL